ncbi:unnamed protein product [Caenorhabditis auriculariae]|uniref:Cyclin-dependent kinase 12 n=1 Tax=Caenorhabditis auriculariae TaxID=2777116 RepID=A0A8S1GYB0_9PELO|nr:unnamed protein product [Caenorhabditis auriculariae]
MSSGRRADRNSRDDRSPSATPPRSRDSRVRDRRHQERDRTARGDRRRDGKLRKEKKRSRSRSRHRSRTPKRNKRRDKRRYSTESDAELMSSSLISEIAKQHGDVMKNSSAKKKKHRKKHVRDSSSSSSSSPDISSQKRGDGAMNGSSTSLNIPAPCMPPSFDPSSYSFFHHSIIQPVPPPPAAPYFGNCFIPPVPPPPNANPEALRVAQQFSATPTFGIVSAPPSVPPPRIVCGVQLSTITPPERLPSIAPEMVHADISASTSRTRVGIVDGLPLPNVHSMDQIKRRKPPAPVIINRKGSRRNQLAGAEWGMTVLGDYELLDQIGEGTYGQVYKATNRRTGEQVALKRVRLENEKEGFPITAVREIKILRQLNHKNIVRLIDIVTDDVSMHDLRNSRVNFYLVFEYVDHDLMGLLESKNLFNVDEVQICSLFKQLLEGLAYCHKAGFLHRDIKCSNILVNNKGELKVADLGLARFWHEDMERPYTNRVITLWYRPPELLLGEEHYGPAIDVWSVGCMLGELFTRKPLFCGNNESAQLELISKMCGSPTPDLWPEVVVLPLYGTLKPKKIYSRRLYDEFRCIMPEQALNLLDRMLTLDPKKRISAQAALAHPWIRELDNKFVPPIQLPQHQDCHEMWSKKQKKKLQQSSLPSISSTVSRPSSSVQSVGRYVPESQKHEVRQEVVRKVREYLENPYSSKKADELTKNFESLSEDIASVYVEALMEFIPLCRLAMPSIPPNLSCKERIAEFVKFYLKSEKPRQPSAAANDAYFHQQPPQRPFNGDGQHSRPFGFPPPPGSF